MPMRSWQEIPVADNDNIDLDRLLVGEGGNTISLGAHRGNVLILFGASKDQNYKQIGFITLAPEEARQAAEALARSAYESHYGVVPDSGRSMLSDTKRVAMVRRVALMMSSFARKRPLSAKPDENVKAAQSIVDTVLSEVL